MIPQPKVNRHVFNLIIARGLAECEKDQAKLNIEKRKIRLEKLFEQLEDINKKISKETEKITQLEKVIDAPLPDLPEGTEPLPNIKFSSSSVTPSEFVTPSHPQKLPKSF